MAKKKQQNALVRTEKYFQSLIENAHDGIVVYDENGFIKYASKSVSHVGGYTEKQVLGKAGTAFLHPQDVENARKAFRNLRAGKTITLLQRIRHKNGHYFWSESRLTNFLHVPEIQGIVSNFRDVNEKKLAEEKLHESQDLLNTINANVSEGIFIGVIGRRFIYANQAFLSLLRYKSLDDLEKIKPQHLYVERKQRSLIHAELQLKGVVRNAEVLLQRTDGKTFWGLMNIRKVKYHDNPNCFVGNIRDITRQRESEMQLRHSEQLLTSISSNISEGIFRSDIEKGLVYLNQAYIEMFGYGSHKATLAVHPERLYVNPDVRAQFIKRLKKEKRISNIEIQFKRKNGSTFWALLSAALLKGEDGRFYIDGAIRDISKQKLVEKEVTDSRNFLQNIMNTVAAPIFVKDAQHRFVLFNTSFLNGRRPEDVFGKTDMDLEPPEYARSYHRTDSEILKTGKTITTEISLRDDKGEEKNVLTTKSLYKNETGQVYVIGFTLDITLRKRAEDTIQKLYAKLKSVLESTEDRIVAINTRLQFTLFNESFRYSLEQLTGKVINVGDDVVPHIPTSLRDDVRRSLKVALKGKRFIKEFILESNDILEASFCPIRDQDNDVTGVSVFIRNITLRKEIEQKLKHLNDELLWQNEQLAARENELNIAMRELSDRNFELDQLMYKTSHDLRSPLSSILGLTNLARIDREPDSITDYLSKIEDRVRKLDEFVKSMLNYAKVSRAEVRLEPIDLHEVIISSVADLEYLENFKDIETSISCKGKEITFISDPLSIKLIVANIISNAYKYYNPNTQSLLQIDVIITKKQASIVVKDNGIGIRKEHLDKIFDMFYRATERSEGSGLGMYIVKQAVDKLKGTIAIDSLYGSGTSIHIMIPNML